MTMVALTQKSAFGKTLYRPGSRNLARDDFNINLLYYYLSYIPNGSWIKCTAPNILIC